eukprot:COSAG04_NODE_36_length_34202_cov_16.186904_18_plen_246_part_00
MENKQAWRLVHSRRSSRGALPPAAERDAAACQGVHRREGGVRVSCGVALPHLSLPGLSLYLWGRRRSRAVLASRQWVHFGQRTIFLQTDNLFANINLRARRASRFMFCNVRLAELARSRDCSGAASAVFAVRKPPSPPFPPPCLAVPPGAHLPRSRQVHKSRSRLQRRRAPCACTTNRRQVRGDQRRAAGAGRGGQRSPHLSRALKGRGARQTAEFLSSWNGAAGTEQPARTGRALGAFVFARVL